MPRFIQSLNQTSFQFWLLASFVVLVFMMGGASRADAQSLIILRPVSVIVCGMAAITLRREHLIAHRWLVGAFVAISGVMAFHIVPLPPGLWPELPGRQLMVDIDRLAAVGEIARPLSISPVDGRNSLYALSVPLAVLLLGIQLERGELDRFLPLLVAGGALSGLFGLMQAAGGPDGPLYLYRVTNNGSAVGLFANRNHAATLLACLFPMLAVFASSRAGKFNEIRSRQLVAAVIAVVLVPLILVTGSRSGLLSSLIGLIGAAILYFQRPMERSSGKANSGPGSRRGNSLLVGLVVAASLGFLTIYFSRAEAIDRILVVASANDNRADFWLTSSSLFFQFFPWGFGSGSFVEAFKIVEPDALLDASYLNHAHNDWLEAALTFGLAGLLVPAFAVCLYLYRLFHIWRRAGGERRSVTYARMAAIAIAIIAMASISDYPLRTPTLMCFFVLLTIWFARSNEATSPVRVSGHSGSENRAI